MEPFGAWLRRVREERGVSRADVDAALKEADKDARKSAGYTAQVENQRVTAPEKAVCRVIEKAVGLPDGEVWGRAAHERLDRLDPDLWAWHEQQLEAASGLSQVARDVGRYVEGLQVAEQYRQAISGILAAVMDTDARIRTRRSDDYSPEGMEQIRMLAEHGVMEIDITLHEKLAETLGKEEELNADQLIRELLFAMSGEGAETVWVLKRLARFRQSIWSR